MFKMFEFQQEDNLGFYVNMGFLLFWYFKKIIENKILIVVLVIYWKFYIDDQYKRLNYSSLVFFSEYFSVESSCLGFLVNMVDRVFLEKIYSYVGYENIFCYENIYVGYEIII